MKEDFHCTYPANVGWKQLENGPSYPVVNISLDKRYRVSVWEDEKSSGEEPRWWLLSSTNPLYATELDT